MSTLESVEQLLSLFSKYGDVHYGEEVTQTQHMIQCAVLAQQENDSDEMVVAALLHDVGHFIGAQDDTGSPDEDFHHEVLGARCLKGLFTHAVTHPIQLHVAAKRYMCAKDPAYFTSLSPASKHSLALQGGPMTPEQCLKFENSAYFDQAIRLRYYDDHGKELGLELPELSHFEPLLRKLALS